MKALYSLLLAALLLLFTQSVQAQMYRCLDSDGKVRFTDTMKHQYCTPLKLNNRSTAFTGGGSFSGNRSMHNRSAKYEKIIRYYGVRYDIDPNLIRAVIRAESGFNPKAVSKKGAQGLMQLMPATAKELSVSDPFDPKENIRGGTRYLRTLLNTFKNDVRLSLAAYNAGPTLVKKKQSVPRIPETIKYVKRVLRYYQEYKNGRV